MGGKLQESRIPKDGAADGGEWAYSSRILKPATPITDF